MDEAFAYNDGARYQDILRNVDILLQWTPGKQTPSEASAHNQKIYIKTKAILRKLALLYLITVV